MPVVSAFDVETGNRLFTWSRFGGYEVTTRGDTRFSAFCALLDDGRSIEQHFQCDVKGYDPGGTNWELGKGKPPLSNLSRKEMLAIYKSMWYDWADANTDLMDELYELAKEHDYTLSDRFATSELNQAKCLADILNERYQN